MATPKKKKAPSQKAAATKKTARTKPDGRKAEPAPAPTRIAVDARIVAALAPHGFPRGPGPGLGFTPTDDALFARGYPQMRIVEDTPVDAKRLVSDVEKALDAIDPVLRVRVPRALAAAYVRGYEVGPLLFVGEGARPGNEQRRVKRAEAIASDAPVTVAMLERTLRTIGVGMGGDTYVRWRLPEVMHLYEHFVGSDAVARALTDHLVFLGEDLSTWGFAGDPHRLNAAGHALALAFPWILKRVDATLATQLRSRIAAVKPKKKGRADPRGYFLLLSAIAHPERPTPPELHTLELPLSLAHDHADPARAAVARQPAHLASMPGRLAWLLGTGLFAMPKLSISGVLPHPLLDSVLPLRDPGVVRLVAHVASQRAGAKAGGAWLSEHRDYARPILESLAKLDDPKEQKAANAALALLGGAAPAAAPTTEAELEREIAAIFERLGRDLRATNDPEARMARIREAYEAYTEARAAVGDPTPDAYFTHRFGDFGLGEFGMLAVDAI